MDAPAARKKRPAGKSLNKRATQNLRAQEESPPSVPAPEQPAASAKPSPGDTTVAMYDISALDSFVAGKLREEDVQANLGVQEPGEATNSELQSPHGMSSPRSPARQSGDSQAASRNEGAMDTDGSAGLAPDRAAAEVTDSNESSGMSSSTARQPDQGAPKNHTAATSISTFTGKRVPASFSMGKRISQPASSSNDSASETNLWAYQKDAGKRLRDDESLSSADAAPASKKAKASVAFPAMKDAARHLQMTDSYQRPPKRGRAKKPKKFASPLKLSAEEMKKLERENLESQEFKDEHLTVGSMVTATYPGIDPETENWYWGTISKKRRTAGAWLYDVVFIDGDSLENMISSKYITRDDEAYKLNQMPHVSNEVPYPEHVEKYFKRGPMTPLQLSENACKFCEQCTRPACGSCTICQKNQSHIGILGVKQCCYQKMCKYIIVARKAQEVPGLLPDGWLFYFDAATPNSTEASLRLIKQEEATRVPDEYVIDKEILNRIPRKPKWNHVTYPSFETAERMFPEFRSLDANAFYRTIGLVEEEPRPDSYKPPAPRKAHGSCDCVNCDPARGPCRKCFKCLRGAKCIRRICCKKSDGLKATAAPYFPVNWKFFFDPEKYPNQLIGEMPLDGLVIVSPEGTLYRTAEEAAVHFQESPANTVEQFYNHVGIDPKDSDFDRRLASAGSENMGAGKSQVLVRVDTRGPKIPKETHGSSQSVGSSITGVEPAADEAADKSLADLHRRRCKACALCKTPDCGTCNSCVLNASRTRPFKDVCLRKICLRFPEPERRVLADGFPDPKDASQSRWKFFYRPPGREKLDCHKELRGFGFVSPAGVEFKTLNKAFNRHTKQLENVPLATFYKQIGARCNAEVLDDPLLKKGFSNEWLNLNGERRAIYGTVVRIEHGLEEKFNDVKYIVRYGRLREDMEDTTGTALSIPEKDSFSHDRAWGGCLAYEKMMYPDKLELAKDAPFCLTWKVPTMYNRRMAFTRLANGKRERLPQVTIQHKVFRLKFTVKESTIPNAGYGVFLSCDVWDTTGEQPTVFELPAGQLLDFGVYAPLRPEDRRCDHEFLMKNFVHNFRCQEYAFDAEEDNPEGGIFDITDDHTGLLHFEARRHITPYVNEVASAKDAATVHAKYDCEGGLHYLLGHEKLDDGPFLLEVGQEIEIFVNYGPRYEDVRLRQGYSHKEWDPNVVRARLKKDEIEHLHETDTYTADEVKSTIQVFTRALERKDEMPQEVTERIILVLLLLKKRAKNIFMQFEGLEDDESVCSNGGRDTSSVLAMSRECTRLIKSCVGIWANKMELHSQLMGEEIYVEALKLVFSGKELECPPAEFVNLLCRE